VFATAAPQARAMLDNVSEEVRLCYLKAEECRQRARIAFDAEAIARFLALAQNWLDLAQSYEDALTLTRFNPK
jgi:hypothetical protein